MLPVAIIAGGLATRLGSIAAEVPKSLVSVCGRPFIEHQLDYLRTQGVREVVLCIGHLGDLIQAEIGDGDQFDMRVNYSIDGPTLLGTGGAIRKALPLLGEEFFVLYGDSFLPVGYRPVYDYYVVSEKSGLMTVMENSNRWDRSNIFFRDEEIILYEKGNTSSKMRHIDYGLGILQASEVMKWSTDIKFDIGDIYRDLIRRSELSCFEVFERFYEIGSQVGLQETEAYLRVKAGHEYS